jgi:hypothetical protein
MPCNAFYTRFIFLESFHLYYNLICIFLYALLFAQNFILLKSGCYRFPRVFGSFSVVFALSLSPAARALWLHVVSCKWMPVSFLSYRIKKLKVSYFQFHRTSSQGVRWNACEDMNWFLVWVLSSVSHVVLPASIRVSTMILTRFRGPIVVW